MRKFLTHSINFIKRIKQVNVSTGQLISDFLIFLGYFTVSSSLGGISFHKSYYDQFKISEGIFPNNFTYYSMIFIKDIILEEDLYIFLSLLFFIVLASSYFLSRYVFRTWLGYTILCLLFGGSILLTVSMGKQLGDETALKNWILQSSTLPTVVISFNPQGCEPAKKDYSKIDNPLILYENTETIYIIEPKRYENDEGRVINIRKNCLQMSQRTN